jgi:hypothetical protein
VQALPSDPVHAPPESEQSLPPAARYPR